MFNISGGSDSLSDRPANMEYPGMGNQPEPLIGQVDP